MKEITQKTRTQRRFFNAEPLRWRRVLLAHKRFHRPRKEAKTEAEVRMAAQCNISNNGNINNRTIKSLQNNKKKLLQLLQQLI